MLVAESDALWLEALQKVLLEKFKVVSDGAANGNQAIDKFFDDRQKHCCTTHYRLILIDLDLPEIDGYTASKEILDY